MATEKQITANRKNALKGGVKTDAGKSTTRQNGMKHGFFSKIVTDFDKLAQKVYTTTFPLLMFMKPNLLRSFSPIYWHTEEFVSLRASLFQMILKRQSMVMRGFLLSLGEARIKINSEQP